MASHLLSRPLAVGDAARLAVLDGYDVLDTPPEEGFDDVVRLATLACEAPAGLVSLVTENRQWFKARVGFPHCQTDLDRSVCAFVLEGPDLLVIPDLQADPRTAHNALVTGEPHLRFYAGAPLCTPDGHVLGSLCVIDTVARPAGLTLRQADMLRALARQVMTLLELRRPVASRDEPIARPGTAVQPPNAHGSRFEISEAHWRGLFERLAEGFIIAELVRDAAGLPVDWRYLDVNPAWGELVGVDPAGIVGRTVREVFPGVEEEWVSGFARVVETGEGTTFTRPMGSLNRWYEGRAFALNGDRFAVLFVETTGRVWADIYRDALLEVGDQLRELDSTAEMTARVSAVVGQALGATRVGFGRLERSGEHVVIEPDWTVPGMPSISGRHRFEDYGDIRQELLAGEPLILRDVLTDPRTAAAPSAMMDAQIRALVNIPIQEHGRTVAVFLVHDTKPRAWRPETMAFLRNVADRLTSAVARQRAEEQQALLNEELSHRMKNMLAMIQAIAAQTLKGVTEQEAVARFQRRLLALGSAHDVLLQKSWMAATLGEVLEAVLGRSSPLERFSVGGPPVTLGARATLSLSLLLHELATNAAKYGALSVEEGRVAVGWRIDEASHELVFTWTESGGPAVAEPTRQGFGSRLIRAGLTGAGGVSVRYLRSGLAAEMRAGLEQVQAA